MVLCPSCGGHEFTSTGFQCHDCGYAMSSFAIPEHERLKRLISDYETMLAIKSVQQVEREKLLRRLSLAKKELAGFEQFSI